MAKKLKVRIPDKKDDILVETTQSGLAWMRRYQGPLLIGGAVLVGIVVLSVYGVELEKRGDKGAWREYIAVGADATPEAYAALAEKFAGTTVEPWALLDQAHTLAASGTRSDWEAAAEIYKDVSRRFGEDSDLLARLATEGQAAMARELSFQLPAAPPPEKTPDPETPEEPDAPGEETPGEEPPAEGENP